MRDSCRTSKCNTTVVDANKLLMGVNPHVHLITLMANERYKDTEDIAPYFTQHVENLIGTQHADSFCICEVVLKIQQPKTWTPLKWASEFISYLQRLKI